MAERLLTIEGSRRSREDGGFTLIEALISVGITMTVMLAILGMFTTALKVFDANRELTVGTNLANSKLADFKTMSIGAIKAQNPKSDTVESEGVQFSRTWTVADVDVDNDGDFDMVDDIVKIKLDVDWTYRGRPHTVSLTTLTTGKPQ